MSAILQEPLLQMRPMCDGDIDAVMAVESAAYPFPWTHSIFRDCLQVGYCCWLCLIGETIIGYGVMSVAASESHILNICIHPDWQGHGLGRQLMTHLIGIARQHRADTAFLEVRTSNQHAIKLYRSMGFNEVSVRRDYYPGVRGREDALVFARHL